MQRAHASTVTDARLQLKYASNIKQTVNVNTFNYSIFNLGTNPQPGSIHSFVQFRATDIVLVFSDEQFTVLIYYLIY